MTEDEYKEKMYGKIVTNLDSSYGSVYSNASKIIDTNLKRMPLDIETKDFRLDLE